MHFFLLHYLRSSHSDQEKWLITFTVTESFYNLFIFQTVKVYKKIFIFGRITFSLLPRLSLVAESPTLLLQCIGFSLQWHLLSLSTGSRHTGFSSCSPRA